MEPRRSVFSHIDLFSARDTLFQNRAEGEPPIIELQVLPEGEFDHPSYGKLSWTPEIFQDMITNFTEKAMGADPMLNFDHSTHNWFAVHSPAAGWPIRLEHKPGVGLFAFVKLTPKAEQSIKNEEYRYISAEVADEMTTSTGRKLRNVLTGMALTNVPFHDTMTGLFGKEAIPTVCLSKKNGVVTWAPKEKEKPMAKTLKEKFQEFLHLLPEDKKKDFKELESELTAENKNLSSQEDPPVDDLVTVTTSVTAPADFHKKGEAILPEPARLEVAEGLSEMISLKKEELEELKKMAQDGHKANLLLMEQQAENRVHKYSGPGFIPNNEESLKAAKEIALKMPKEFDSLFNAILKAGGRAPVDPINPLLPHSTFTGGARGSSEYGNDESFTSVVDTYVEKYNIPRIEAMERVQSDRPELYEKHRLESIQTK